MIDKEIRYITEEFCEGCPYSDLEVHCNKMYANDKIMATDHRVECRNMKSCLWAYGHRVNN